VFANGVDTGASNNGYLDADVEEAYANVDKLKLKEFILIALKQCICKNNILVAARIVKKTTKKA
jgi:hypothetical protein